MCGLVVLQPEILTTWLDETPLVDGSLEQMNGPEGPVASDGKGLFAAWSCNADDCSGNQMTVFFDSNAGSAQVCWRGSGDGGNVQDLWLTNGKARPLPINSCGYRARNPFAALKKFGGPA